MPRTQPKSEARVESSAVPPVSGPVEAILLSTDKPIGLDRIVEALAAAGHEGVGDALVSAAIEALNTEYDAGGRAFRIERVAGGLRVMVRPEHAPVLAAFHQTRASHRLSRAAIETLAIVAYKQPITRARLEAVRGCACGEVLKTLMDRRLVTIKGRAEELGRPMLYGTTKEFLDAFGLATLKDLPTALELKAAT